MFKMITWPQYLGAVVILLIVYYAYVALVYYRVELTGLLAGKRRAASDPASPAAPPSRPGRGELIPTAAIVLPVPATPPAAPEEAAPETDAAREELGAESGAEVTAAAPHEGAEQAQPEVSEASSKEVGLNQETGFNDIDKPHVENPDKLPGVESPALASVAAAAEEDTTEEQAEDFTIGVAQLSNYFDRAAAGELSREQLLQEVPELENTAVLVAFYKNSTQSAQQLTATLYGEEAEPALNERF